MKHLKLSRMARAIATTLAGSMFILQPATASLPDRHIFNDADEISDADLAGMRGRYVGTGEILYFGVAMYTQWQTQDGRTLNAGLSNPAGMPTGVLQSSLDSLRGLRQAGSY